jgi:hypothetical protein
MKTTTFFVLMLNAAAQLRITDCLSSKPAVTADKY